MDRSIRRSVGPKQTGNAIEEKKCTRSISVKCLNSISGLIFFKKSIFEESLESGLNETHFSLRDGDANLHEITFMQNESNHFPHYQTRMTNHLCKTSLMIFPFFELMSFSCKLSKKTLQSNQ